MLFNSNPNFFETYKILKCFLLFIFRKHVIRSLCRSRDRILGGLPRLIGQCVSAYWQNRSVPNAPRWQRAPPARLTAKRRARLGDRPRELRWERAEVLFFKHFLYLPFQKWYNFPGRGFENAIPIHICSSDHPDFFLWNKPAEENPMTKTSWSSRFSDRENRWALNKTNSLNLRIRQSPPICICITYNYHLKRKESLCY